VAASLWLAVCGFSAAFSLNEFGASEIYNDPTQETTPKNG